MGVARKAVSAKALVAATLIAAQGAFGVGASRAAEGPNLPPAEYRPLPVGTNIIYDNATIIVARTDGYTTVLKKDDRGGATSWIPTHALFGEYGRDVYARDVHAEPLEYDIGSADQKKLEVLWPLVVGKQAEYRVIEAANRFVPMQEWTITLTVTGTETVDIGGRRYETYVVEEQGKSDGGMGFRGRKWYHPGAGLIVRSQDRDRPHYYRRQLPQGR